MTILFALLAVLAGFIPLWPVYHATSFIVAAVVGTFLGVGVGFALRWWRWPWWSVVPTLVVVYAVVAVPLAVPTEAVGGVLPTLQGESQAFGGVVTAWKELVTINPPVGDFGTLLVPVLVTSLIAGAATVMLARNPRWRALSVLPALVTLGLSIWLGVGQSAVALPAGLAVAAFIALALMARVPGGFVRKLTAVGLSVLAVALGGVASTAANSQPAVWRYRVTPALDTQSLPSPLSSFRAYVTGEFSQMPMFAAAGVSPGDMMSLATLAKYDGVMYTVGAPDGDFTRQSGFAVDGAAPGQSVTFDIDQLTGPWLPLPGRPAGLSATDSTIDAIYYSPQAATAIDLNGLSRGVRYNAVGSPLTAVPLNQLADAKPGKAQTAVVDEPTGVQAFAQAHTNSADADGKRLVQVMQALQDVGYVSHGGAGEAPSRAGHSAERITALLTDKLMVGDAEQYSVAAALLAQQVGFPARVVVGFVVPNEGSQIRGSDMTAWTEVATSDGWVAFDPTPPVRPIPETPPEDPVKVSPPQSAVEPPPADVSQTRADVAAQSNQRNPVTPPDPWRDVLTLAAQVVAWLALAAVVLLLPPLSIVAVKASRRRRRRHTGSPRSRVVGARDQVADALRDARLQVTPATTNRELCEMADRQGATRLAVLADRAEYDTVEPGSRDANLAWETADDIEQSLRRNLTRLERWRRTLSLRSLARRHRVSRDGRASRSLS